MKKISITTCLILTSAVTAMAGVIVADDFNRADATSLGSTSTGGFAWNEQETSASGLRIFGSQALAGSTTSGREYASINLSTAPGYSTTLANNSGVITWTINMRTSRSDPSGLGDDNSAMAFILAATTADIYTAKGYVVYIGGQNSPDALRLAKFSGGLNSSANAATLTSGGGFGSDYLSVRVTYNPSGNQWSLFGTGGTSFSDPTAITTQLGTTVVNANYVNEALSYSGFMWNHGIAPESATFDNFSISSVPEPAASGVICALGLLSVCGWREWRTSRQPPTL